MSDLTIHSNTESFIGDIKRLVEQEQKGKERAEYGTQLIEMLSAELTRTYGKGFSIRNLWLFKQFYLTFNDLEPSNR
ncbi:MAG: hypothetical protein IJ622_09450 [Bacteroidales bacterium]|nr:hypothetical protein [Bacteroidales bacterium]